MSRRTKLVPMEIISPNDAPSREEYLALVGALYAAEDLLSALEARGDAGGVRDEHRALSNAVGLSRVEMRKTAQATE